MSKEREALAERMIAIYGMEHPIVIDFCWMCEEWEENEWNNTVLDILVKAHEECPVRED